MRELTSRPASTDDLVGDLLSKIHDVDEAFAGFERQFQQLTLPDQRAVTAEINIADARNDRKILYQRLETHAVELASGLLRTGNPEQETFESLSEVASILNGRERDMVNPPLRADVNALRTLLTAVEGAFQKFLD